MGLRIAIDTGGTFTDIVAIDEDTGAITATKTPSTPDDPSVGLVEGVRKVLKAAGGEPTDVHMLLHGSTVATNAGLEHKFDRLGLLVHQGLPPSDRDRPPVGAGRLRQFLLLGEAAASGAAAPCSRSARPAALRRQGGGGA